jgi:hypothetical protein
MQVKGLFLININAILPYLSKLFVKLWSIKATCTFK